MLSGIQRYRDVVAVSICLMVPVVVLYANSRSDAEAGPAVRALLRLTSPVQDAMERVVAAVSDSWTEHRQNAQALDEARKTRMDMARLRAAVDRVEELERENGRLRALLNAAPTPGAARFMASRVVAVGASPAYRTVRVDVGRDDGVQRGMAVVAPEGAVGSVMRTSGGYSDVMLVSDRQSSVDVMVARTGVRGLLRGSGAEGDVLLKVEGLDRTAQVQTGDEIVATGLGARFPRGTRVGVVVATEIPEGSLTQTADVRPAVTFESLRDVLVILAPEQALLQRQPAGPQPEPSDAPASNSPTTTVPAGPQPQPTLEMPL